MQRLNTFLFGRIDNSPLIAFRIFLGLLLLLESWGAIATGWVREVFVEPDFTFSFIGFEWLQPLPGWGMYAYYLLMGVLGLFILIGYRYRLSMFLFTLMWTAVYLMQKSAYNNHYYLLILICAMMTFMPAERYLSVDVKRNPTLYKLSMPRWVSVVFIIQLFIVYTYAAIAKMYPDWLDLTVVTNLMEGRKHFLLVGDILQSEGLIYILTYGGILFDLLIIPLMLWRPTRIFAFGLSLFFHLFNSVILHIGIFPYLAIALYLFFFPPENIRKWFFRNKKPDFSEQLTFPKHIRTVYIIFSFYFLLQIGLPLRHYFIPGDVLWTEEGHRLSWRMMLRSKGGYVRFQIKDKNRDWDTVVHPRSLLTQRQLQKIGCYPDFMWQFARRLKNQYSKKGRDVAVYAVGKATVNNHDLRPMIDPEVDLASEPWSQWKHHHWILPYDQGKH